MVEELQLRQEKLIEDLTEAVRDLLDRTVWYKNIKIENKVDERKRFKEARRNGENFTPDFEFREHPHNKKELLEKIEECINASKEIGEKHLKMYSAEELTPEDLQNFFTEIFKELELYVELATNIEDEKSWREYSEKLWPMIDEEKVEKSREKLEDLQNKDQEKTVKPKEVAELFREEIDRIGAEYTVETREVGGCHNIPEEKTVVVAEGENGERMYSQEEAHMLTMHELFHAIRAYNGFKAGEKSGFPEILGLHTPFYDRAEEGGALYREEATNTAYENKEFDYHLRLIAAYEIYQSNDYREDFQEIVEKLIDLGGDVDRCFYLAARNREALRHHIYQAGREDWQEIEDKEKMLLGKVNEKWADKLQKEVGGMLQGPAISAEKLFDFQFNS